MIKIEDWMSKPVVLVKPSITVKEAVQVMDKENIGVLPIVDNGVLKGIVTERDILRRVVAKNINIENTNISEIMTKNPVTVNHDSSILEVTRLMSENNFRRLIVMKHNKVVGIVTAKDVIEVLSA